MKKETLNDNQKAQLLILYFECMWYESTLYNLSSKERIKEINHFIKSHALPIQITIQQNEKFVFNQLCTKFAEAVYDNIPKHELKNLLSLAYDELNLKYNLDNQYTNNTPNQKGSLNRNLKSNDLVLNIERLINEYHSIELTKARNKSFWQTILFCLPIVTIPFSRLFFNARLKANSENNLYIPMRVDDKLKEAIHKSNNSTSKVINTISNYSGEKVYGMMKKYELNNGRGISLKNIIFNKDNEVRKIIPFTGQWFDLSKTNSLHLLGSKKQILKSAGKFEESSRMQYQRNNF